ncbi:hypothetical protein JCM10212_006489 [Sporobolomyces blumeae]
MIFFLLAAVIRWWKSILWLFQRTKGSPLIVPNFAVVCTSTAIAILILFQVCLARSIESQQGWLHNDYGFWLLFVGPCRYLAGHVVGWSLGAAVVLQQQATGANVAVWSWLCNVVGTSTPIVTIAISFVLAVRGAIAYSHAVATYEKLSSLLVDQALTWSPDRLATAFVPPPVELTDDLSKYLDRVGETWRDSYLWQAIAGSILVVLLLIVGTAYLVPVRRSMIHASTSLEVSTIECRNAAATTNRQKAQLRPTWAVMIMVLTSFVLGFSASATVDFIVYLRPFSFSSWTTSLTALFLPYYLSSLPALLCGIASTYMAVMAESNAKPGWGQKGWEWVRWKVGKGRGFGFGVGSTYRKRRASGVGSGQGSGGGGGSDDGVSPTAVRGGGGGGGAAPERRKSRTVDASRTNDSDRSASDTVVVLLDPSKNSSATKLDDEDEKGQEKESPKDEFSATIEMSQ